MERSNAGFLQLENDCHKLADVAVCDSLFRTHLLFHFEKPFYYPGAWFNLLLLYDGANPLHKLDRVCDLVSDRSGDLLFLWIL